MARRLLKTHRGSGLYEYSHPKIGRWEEWHPLPPVPAIETISPITPAGPTEVALGLYGGDDRARRDTERRRKVKTHCSRSVACGRGRSEGTAGAVG